MEKSMASTIFRLLLIFSTFAIISWVSPVLSAETASPEKVGTGSYNDTINQASVVTREISQDISGVSSVSTEIFNANIQLTENSVGLNQMAENLRDIVTTFKV